MPGYNNMNNDMNIEIPANTTKVLNQADLPAGEITITVAENAKLIQYQVVDSDKDFAQKIVVKQHANSYFEQHFINLQASKVQREMVINLLEPGANCILTGIYVAKNQEIVDNNIKILHHAKNCQSLQDYRGVLLDASKVSLESLVHVPEHASLTNASQHSKHLLASNRANIKVSPSLEIFHDDVMCAHGASIGELDANMVFYLQSRGLTQDAARDLIIKGFIISQLAYISDEAMRKTIQHAIEKQWFRQLLEIEA